MHFSIAGRAPGARLRIHVQLPGARLRIEICQLPSARRARAYDEYTRAGRGQVDHSVGTRVESRATCWTGN